MSHTCSQVYYIAPSVSGSLDSYKLAIWSSHLRICCRVHGWYALAICEPKQKILDPTKITIGCQIMSLYTLYCKPWLLETNICGHRRSKNRGFPSPATRGRSDLLYGQGLKHISDHGVTEWSVLWQVVSEVICVSRDPTVQSEPWAEVCRLGTNATLFFCFTFWFAALHQVPITFSCFT